MQLLDTLLSVVAPLDCLGCGDEGTLACSMCLATVPTVPSRCYRCQSATTEFLVCQACKRYTALRHVWVASVFDGLVKEIIHTYKYERALSAYKELAAMATEALPYLDDMLVVAVPTATTRRRQRGYDHALLLAKQIAHKKDLVFESPIVRLSQARQVGASRKARFEQLQNSFHITKPHKLVGKKVLLVDDVITSGATLETLAALLKKAGAKEVNALVCAQKL